MIISIHQSQYLPWPPYFKKIAKSDVFVVLDDVQFQKNGVQNRNKLRNQQEDFWLTIPVRGGLKDNINKKEIADSRWKKKHHLSIKQSYSKSRFWEIYNHEIEEIFQNDRKYLHEINNDFLKFFLKTFEIETKIFLSSEINVKGSKSDLVLNICKYFGAKKYLSGIGSKDYLDLKSFEKEKVEIEFLDFNSPKYEQYHGDFISDLSMLDMLMNVEKQEIINNYLLGSNN